MHDTAVLSPSANRIGLETYRFALLRDRLSRVALWFCGCIGLLLPVSIIGYLIIEGIHCVSWSFLLDYPKGTPLGTEGGIRPAVEGSLALASIGLSVAFPLALGGGLYLSEYSHSKQFNQIVRFLVECLAAVPSIIYGLFGYAFLVVFLKFGISLIAGGLVLALIMFPILLIAVQESLRSVDDAYREMGLSLGVTRLYLIRRVLLRKAWRGIVAGIVLAVGHAVGSAAPVLFTASIYFSKGGLGLDRPVMTLPTHLYNLVSEAISFDQAFGTALVLIAGLLIFNASAMLLRRLGGGSTQ
ncbi:MAG: phosphate ABC transporter permease PstA [Deltaproteobacteria bacterium]|nr:MAG: phosphate ABC transporter permease PstA [Deltaproteobacteria bacterium]